METASGVLFALALGLLLFAHPAYPLLLRLLPPRRETERSTAHRPTVSLLVSAKNEEAVIGRKIENTLSLDYPSVQPVFVSDGSTDRTAEILRSHEQEGVVVREIPDGRGKNRALHEAALPAATGEILLFSDANSMFDRDAVAKLVEPFADPAVGAAGGRLFYQTPGAVGRGERAFMRGESRVKRLESRAGFVTGLYGGIFAVRRGLYREVPGDRCIDFDMPVGIQLDGHRAVFVPEAVTREEVAVRPAAEFRRRARISAQAIPSAVRFMGRAIARGRLRLATGILRRLVRWLGGPLLLVLLASTIGLQAVEWRGVAIFRIAAALQAVVYAAALAGSIVRVPPLSTLWHFLVLNAGVTAGLLRAIAGRAPASWTPAR